MKWCDRMPWSSFSECWALSQLFHSPLLVENFCNVYIAHGDCFYGLSYFQWLTSSSDFVPCSNLSPTPSVVMTKLILTPAAAKSPQSCPTLCDPIDSSPPGSPVPGVLQARTLGWVAISFSSARKWKVKVKMLSRVWLLATPWTAAYQAPPSMGFSRQEYWSGVPLPSLIKDV